MSRSDDPILCNRCAAVADLGMTCVGPRCRNCGCDNARRPDEELESIWGPFHVEVSEETERLWGPLSVPASEGRGDW